jgi:hypothetical protein
MDKLVYTWKEVEKNERKHIGRVIILTFCSFEYGKIGNFAVKMSSTLVSAFLYVDITKILVFTIAVKE